MAVWLCSEALLCLLDTVIGNLAIADFKGDLNVLFSSFPTLKKIIKDVPDQVHPIKCISMRGWVTRIKFLITSLIFKALESLRFGLPVNVEEFYRG